MKLMRSIGLVAMLAAVALVSADAQSLKVRQLMESADKDFARQADPLNDKCGTKMTAKIDWANAVEDDVTHYTVASYCEAGTKAINRVCNNPTGKKAVMEKIKTVTCGFGKEPSMSLKDGALDYKITFQQSKDEEFFFQYLEDHL